MRSANPLPEVWRADWQRDFGARGITINVVQPGPIDTNANPADEPMRDLIHGFIVLKRHERPEEAAAMVAWLSEPTHVW